MFPKYYSIYLKKFINCRIIEIFFSSQQIEENNKRCCCLISEPTTRKGETKTPAAHQPPPPRFLCGNGRHVHATKMAFVPPPISASPSQWGQSGPHLVLFDPRRSLGANQWTCSIGTVHEAQASSSAPSISALRGLLARHLYIYYLIASSPSLALDATFACCRCCCAAAPALLASSPEGVCR